MAGWDTLKGLLDEELKQRNEEGCDTEGFEKIIATAANDKEREVVYRKLMRLKRKKKNFQYREPSELKKILRKRPKFPIDKIEFSISEDQLYDKVYGAWLGRCAGCALGKPIEGWGKESIEKYLKNAGAYPLDYYVPSVSKNEKGDQIKASCPQSTRENIKFMEVDDDINYTVAGLVIAEQSGLNFTTQDIGNFWLSSLPYKDVCTAERQAYLNLANVLPIEEVPVFHNPYREWIGAQIRADFWGYMSPGKPKQAAELAFRDAALSHVKNGIYGEMFVAAMIAAAFAENDIKKIIQVAASQIPKTSRLYEAIQDCLEWSKLLNWQQAFETMMSKYGRYHQVHTINNACIVLIGLLFSENDLEKAITIAVMCGLDTDCNGATAGSIMGAILGAKALPEKWIKPLNDTLSSTIVSSSDSFFRVKISELAQRTVGIIKRSNK